MPGQSAAPLLIAHRGMSRQHPENTMPAFEAAVAAGADMIELDVALASDGVFIVMHDDTLMRTTDSTGFVCHYPSKEIEGLDAGLWFGPEHSDITVPLLDHVLDRIADRIALNIEIKPFFPLNQAGRMQAALARLVTLLDERKLLDQTILSSVNFFLLEYIRELHADVRLGLIFRRPLTDYDPVYVCRAMGIYSLHPWHVQVTGELVQALHHIGVKVFPYTVNELPRLQQLMEMGVDGVFTDIPDQLRGALKAA